MKHVVGHYTRSNTFVVDRVFDSLEDAKLWTNLQIKSGYTVEHNTDEKTKQYKAWARNDFVILEEKSN